MTIEIEIKNTLEIITETRFANIIIKVTKDDNYIGENSLRSVDVQNVDSILSSIANNMVTKWESEQ